MSAKDNCLKILLAIVAFVANGCWKATAEISRGGIWETSRISISNRNTDLTSQFDMPRELSKNSRHGFGCYL